MDRFQLLGAFLQLVGAIFAFNLIALVYRLIAIVDAYRVTEYLNAHDGSPATAGSERRRCRATPCRWRASRR